MREDKFSLFYTIVDAVFKIIEFIVHFCFYLINNIFTATYFSEKKLRTVRKKCSEQLNRVVIHIKKK